MINRVSHIFVLSAIALTIATSTALSEGVVEVQHLFSIDEHISAPSLLDVSDNHLSVFDPFQKRLTQFTAEGIYSESLYLTEKISSIMRLADGTYFLTDPGSGVVWKLEPGDGTLTIVTELSAISKPIDCMKLPSGMAILDASGSLFIMDGSGVVTGKIDIVDNGGERIGYASCAAFDPVTNSFFILELTSSKIWQIAADGEFIRIIAAFGGGEGEITRGGDIACIDNAVLVSDRYQGRIAVFATDGRFLKNLKLDSTATGRLSVPSGLGVDQSGIFYIASTESGTVHAYTISVEYSSSINLTAYPILPEPFDTLSPEGVVFTANYYGPDSVEAIFDFELYRAGDASEIISETSVVASVDSLSNGSGAKVARWKPDISLESDSAYWWRTRVRWNDLSGEWSAMRLFYTSSLPGRYALSQNYPNPFNPSTTIAFEVPRDMQVRLEVLNILGQKVATLVDRVVAKGEHSVVWNGATDAGHAVATGPYFYRLIADDFVKSRKMVVIK